MKQYKFIILSLCSLFLLFTSCSDAEELRPNLEATMTGLSVYLPDGDKLDFAAKPDENNVINITIEGSIKTDLTKLTMFVNVPNNVRVESETPMGSYMDFTKPVAFDLVGPTGERKSYTVKAHILATKINVEELWRKTGSEISFTKDNNRSVAISGDYLVVHDRAAKGAYKYYDLQTGAEAGVLSTEGMEAIDPLHMISDDAGNIVTANFLWKGNGDFKLYWWSGVDAKPAKLIEWKSDLSNDLGRKLYVKGDMEDLAYIYATVSNENTFLRWEVKNGEVTSNEPDKVVVNHPNNKGWGVNGRVIPTELGKDANYFINSSRVVRITYMDGADNSPIYNSEESIQNVFHQWLPGGGHAFDYVDLNGARYLFIIEQDGKSWAREIFSVHKMMSDPSSINTIVDLVHTRKWNDWLDFPLDSALGGANTNITGEVKAQVAEDGKSAVVAYIATNGGVQVFKVELQ